MKRLKFLKKLLVTSILITLFSCNGTVQDNTKANAGIDDVADEIPYESSDDVEDIPIDINDDELGSISSGGNPVILPKPIEDDYEVILSVNDTIYTGQTGTMRVWIGSKKNSMEPIEDMVHAETSIPSDLGKYAITKANAPGFIVEMIGDTCYRLHSSGSEKLFTLTPKENVPDSYKVSAVIEIFEGADCSGKPFPKASRELTVRVIVDTETQNYKTKEKFMQVFMDKLFSFWGLILTIGFAFLIYIIRRFLKNKTGFEE